VHLGEEELVDAADGALSTADRRRVESHLAQCAACRQQLGDLHQTLASVAAVDVPEPSPLFWGHFSRRVHEAVDGEVQRPRGRSWLHWLFPAAAVAALLLFVVAPGVWLRIVQPSLPSVGQPRETLADVTDPSLTLVAELTDGIGWESEHEAGLAPRGSAEHAVTHLNDRELRELQRLLKEELAHPTD